MSKPVNDLEAAIDKDIGRLEAELTSLFEELRNEIDVSIVSGESFSIGKYRLLNLLNRSGQAYVFRALDTHLQRVVVVKLYRQDIPETEKIRVLREGQAMSRIDHPHVARCHTVDKHNGVPFLVMEYVHGETLQEYAQRVKPGPTDCIRILRQIGEGLQAAHDQDFLHLDLKPGNVMVTDDGQAKVIDFGLARSTDAIEVGESSGTPCYVAPERARGQENLVGRATDVFGLGGVLYYLLTGIPPFHGETREQVLEAARLGMVTEPIRLVEGISYDINQFCCKCLLAEPNQRFSNVNEFLVEATRITESNQVARRKLAGLVVVGLVVLGATLAYINPWSGVDGHRMPVPSPETIGEIRSDLLPNDFSLGWRLQTRRNGHWIDTPLNNEGVFQVPLGPDARLQVKPEKMCWLAVYGYDTAKGSTTLRFRIYSPIMGQEDFRSSVHDPFEIVFEPDESPVNTTEFIYLVGFTAKWDPHRAKQVDDLIAEKIESFRRNPRGLTRDDQISCVRIPYHVSPMDGYAAN